MDDKFQDHLWDPKMVLAPSSTSIETHEIDVYPRCEGENGVAYFEDVPATFNVERGSDGVRAEFIQFKVGSMAITRGMLCQMLSSAEVQEIERRVSVEIAEARG